MKKFDFVVEVTPSQNELGGRQWAGNNWRLKFLRQMHNFELVGFNKERKKVLIKITRYGCRTLDQGNFIGGCKQLLDSMKDKKLIVDDSPEWIEVTYKQIKVEHRKDERTKVELETI